MRTMIGALKRTSSGHLGKTLITAADAALDGARGNSGAILAQFFQGLCDSATEYPILNTRQFSRAVACGARCAAQALQEPVEGTILTVVSDYSNAVADWAEKRAGPDFIALLHHGLEQAKRSLARNFSLCSKATPSIHRLRSRRRVTFGDSFSFCAATTSKLFRSA